MPVRRSFNRFTKNRLLFVTCLENRLAPAVFVVTSAADSGAGSLRQTILDANVNNEADTISFASSVSTISLTTGQLGINSDLNGLSIVGPGASLLEISSSGPASAINRLFDIDVANGSAAISISGLTLKGGLLTSTQNGGAIRIADEYVSLTSLTIRGN